MKCPPSSQRQIQGFISKLKLQRCAQQYGLYTQTSWQLKPFMERATDIALPFYEEVRLGLGEEDPVLFSL